MASIFLHQRNHHDEQVGASFDQSLSSNTSDGLRPGLLAQRHMGYSRRSYQSHSNLAGSICGCHGPLAGTMVSLRPYTTDRECLRESQINLYSSQRHSSEPILDQSALADQVDASSSRSRKRPSMVESYPRLVRRKGTLGHFYLGEEAAVSASRVFFGSSQRQQRRRVAALGGVSGGQSSFENRRRQWQRGDTVSHNDWPDPTLAGHIQSSNTRTLQRQPLVARGESGTSSKLRVQSLPVLRMVGSVQDKAATRERAEQFEEERVRRVVDGQALQRDPCTRGDCTQYKDLGEVFGPTILNTMAKGGDKKQKAQKTHNSGKGNSSTTGMEGTKNKGASSCSKHGGPLTTRDNDCGDRKKRSGPGKEAVGTARSGFLARIENAWNDFFFARTCMLGAAATLRAAYAMVVVINLCLLVLDLDFFLNVMPTPLARETMDQDTLTLLVLFKDTVFWPKVFVYMWMIHAIFLGLGIASQLQAFGVFFFHVQMAHHNALLWNGEDFVMRLLAFFLIFFPNSHSVLELWSGKRGTIQSWPMVRLFASSSYATFIHKL